MNKIILLCFCTLFFVGTNGVAQATEVYVTHYAGNAKKRVFVVKDARRANCFVYKSPHPTKQKGRWFFVKKPKKSTVKIYFSRYASSADLKVFFVKVPGRVRCTL